MKIGYFIDRLSTPGGMEHLLVFKANYLFTLGYEVHIILIENKKNKPFFKINDAIKIHYLDLEDRMPKQKLMGTFLSEKYSQEHFDKVENLLTEIKLDVSISLFNSERAFLYKINDHSKKVVEFHFSYSGLLASTQVAKYPFLTKLYFKYLKLEQYKKTIKKYDRFVVTTNQDYNDWGSLKNSKMIANPYVSGIEENKFPNYKNKTILSVGKTNYIKGYDLLVEAWKNIEIKHPDWSLKIIGRRNDTDDNLDVVINEYKLKNIQILSPQKKLEDHFYNSSIYVSTSRFEGFPLTLLQAQTCGLPIVAFDCPTGPKEIVKDKKNGLLVKYLDIKDLENKIEYLILEDRKREKMGRKAKEDVLMYSPKVIMKEWDKLFKSII